MNLLNASLRSRTAANVIMILIVGLGALGLTRLRRETFPSSDLDMVRVTARYEGASPDDVEQGVLDLIEDQCLTVKGFKTVTGTAGEGRATVVVELREGTDITEVVNDLRDKVGKIDSFPEGVDELTVSEVLRKDPVATLVLSGDAQEATLVRHAQRLRKDLITRRIATEVAIEAVRTREIHISLNPRALEKHRLDIGAIGEAIRAASLNRPLGSLRSVRSDLVLRIRQERRSPEEFGKIVVRRGADGRILTLDRIAEITWAYEETDVGARYNGKPAIVIQVDKDATQDTIETSRLLQARLAEFRSTLPPGLDIDVFTDQSRRIQDRLGLLVDNGIMGLVLVFLVLWFFTEIRVAFWVTWGIPVAFLGTLFVMFLLGLTLNMITMFGLLIVLGMIVDDAVVVAENIFAKIKKSRSVYEAALEGTQQVFWPIVASSITTMGAFVPLFFVSGRMGRTMGALPWVIVAALTVSLIEVFLSLPKHLAHGLSRSTGAGRKKTRVRTALESAIDGVLDRVVGPVSKRLLAWRYWVLGGALAMMLLCAGVLLGGRLGFTFFPTPDTNSIVARVRLPVGAPVEATEKMVAEMERALSVVEAKLGAPGSPLIEKTLVRLGETSIDLDRGSHLAQVQVELRDAEERSVTSDDVLASWSEACQVLPGVTSLSFARLERGVGGKELDIRLVGSDWSELDRASAFLGSRLSGLSGLTNIESSLRPGKQEAHLRVSPEGQRLGLSAASLSRQVRDAFQGIVVQRHVSDDQEIVVRALYARDHRARLSDLKDLALTLPAGTGPAVRAPLHKLARIDLTSGYAELQHLDRQRTVAVSAEIDERATTAGKVVGAMRKTLTQEIPSRFPGVQVRLEGQRATQKETFDSLQFGAIIGMLIVFSVLVLVMDGWGAPLLVLAMIPMGLIGMILGHLLMGYNLIMLSVMAGVALGGVVINDAIILLEEFRNSEEGGWESRLLDAVKRRARPIMMTTVTTVAGLSPMLLERSIQAQFLIPMAITLAFGLITGTFGTLVVLPSLVGVVEDFRRLTGREIDPAPKG